MCCNSHNQLGRYDREAIERRYARMRQYEAEVLAEAERKAAEAKKRAADRVIREATEVVRLAPVFLGGEQVAVSPRTRELVEAVVR